MYPQFLFRGSFVLLFTLLLFTGCSASGTVIQPTPETVKNYEVGEIYEANTGSQMLSGGRVATLPAFSPTKTFTPPGRGIGESESPEMTSSQKWQAVMRLEGGGYLLNPPESYPFDNTSLAINADGSVGNGWYAGLGGGTNKTAEQGEWPKGKVFERVEATPQEGSFEFEILYSGKDGGTAKMTYREFLDGMQRADYSQDLSYNVAEQDTISFRSIRMHVKEASGSSIRYEVLEDGGLPWLPQR